MFPPADRVTGYTGECLRCFVFMKVYSKKAEAKIGRSQLLYKLQVRADLKDPLDCAAILENINCPHLGRQFHLSFKFSCLFARIRRQIIGWRNGMAWETKSFTLLTDHNMFWTYSEARQTRLSQPYGANTVATCIDTITIAGAIIPAISPFVA